MIEELLKFFICVINTQLLKAVKLKNLESSYVKDANKACPLVFGTI